MKRLLNMLQKNGISITSPPHFPFNVKTSDIEQVVTKIEAIKKITPKPFFGIVIGAKRPQNRWPKAYFSEVLSHFQKQYTMLLIGGPDDYEMAQSLAKQNAIINLCGQYTPIQSGVWLSNCKMCLSNDTGPMHLAYSFGTPVIAIFSSRDFPYKWFPSIGDHNIIFRNNQIHCSLCLSETCMNNICMQEIRPQEVIQAIEQLSIKL